MTDATAHGPAAVYRLLPSLRDLRTLILQPTSGLRVAGWQRKGENPPEQVDTRWTGGEEAVPAEFACGAPGTPILSRRVAAALGDDLRAAGDLLPVLIDGEEAPDYVFFLVEAVVDCVDERRSSKPQKGTRNMKKTVFLPDRLPAWLPAFRVPQSPWNVHWNGWAKERLADILDGDLEARLVWSEDPSRTPHPHPWGF